MLSFENRVYQSLQKLDYHTPEHKRLLAMDISFDGLGCTYILEWAIETVSQKFLACAITILTKLMILQISYARWYNFKIRT